MGNFAKINSYGYVCPVRGCDKKHNRRFALGGLAKHLIDYHPGELQKRLKLKQEHR